MQRVNLWVNSHVKPMTDMDHWGVVERWNYPDDGYGDCEDYVLLKRKMLMQEGWPREALLITVVRDQNGDGHAVLTVKTDKGEFILDNQSERHPAVVGDRLPLRQAPVAIRSEYLDRARRYRNRAGHRISRHVSSFERSENRNLERDKELRDPGHVPTPPRPQTGFVAAGSPPGAGRTLFHDPTGFSPFAYCLKRRT